MIQQDCLAHSIMCLLAFSQKRSLQHCLLLLNEFSSTAHFTVRSTLDSHVSKDKLKNLTALQLEVSFLLQGQRLHLISCQWCPVQPSNDSNKLPSLELGRDKQRCDSPCSMNWVRVHTSDIQVSSDPQQHSSSKSSVQLINILKCVTVKTPTPRSKATALASAVKRHKTCVVAFPSAKQP